MLLAVGAFGVLAMMVHIVANALVRSLNNTPITGTHEVVTYWYMPLVALVGFVVAQREGAHTEASVVFDRLPRANRRELHLAGLVLTAAVCAGFAYFGWLEAWHNAEIGLTGGMIGVVIWPMTFLAPVAYATLGVQVLVEAGRLLRRRPTRNAPTERETSDAGI